MTSDPIRDFMKPGTLSDSLPGFTEEQTKLFREIARDLDLDVDAFRMWFTRWLNTRWPHETIPAHWRNACYAFYRLEKSSWAFRVASRSRERWYQLATAHGLSLVKSPPVQESEK